jgi:lysine biosynthesis protein LysW
MVKCPDCGVDIDIENVKPGKTVKCPGCGKKFEVIQEGKKKELYETEVDYEDD